MHECCDTKTCENCSFCYKDCEKCCKIPPLNYESCSNFRDLWKVAERFGFKLQARGCDPNSYFEKFPNGPKIFHIISPYQHDETKFSRISYTIDTGKEFPRFIYVLVPDWFENVINKLKNEESYFHRYFYFLYY